MQVLVWKKNEDSPESLISMRPELPSVFHGGSEDGETFMPHELIEERCYPGDSIPSCASGRSESLQLVFSWEREEPPGL